MVRRNRIGEARRDLWTNAFRRLGDEPIHDRFQITRLLEGRELPIGARAFAHDLEGVLDLLPASELVDDIIDPARTREHVSRALEILVTKRTIRPAKKHGLGPT